MNKLLAIDVGNTNVKYGLFLDGKLSQTWTHATAETAAHCAEFLGKCNAPCAIACVSPAAGKLIKAAAGDRLLLEVTGSSQKFLANMAEAMGADRVADAVAAWCLYGKSSQPTVAMSFGTASTLLLIDADGRVVGGWIMSGVTSQLEVMHERCALLPLLKMENQSSELGTDTETHMRNGVFVGCIGAAREWLKTAANQVSGKSISVATGGWATTLQEHGKVFDHVDPALTLKGIYLIASQTGTHLAKPAA